MAKAKKKKVVRSFVVNRRRWKRGDAAGLAAALLSDSGQMCCLGFLARECGLKPRQILNASDISSIVDEEAREGVYDALPAKFRDLEEKIVCANDSSDPDHRGRLRETILKGLFARAGIEISFKG